MEPAILEEAEALISGAPQIPKEHAELLEDAEYGVPEEENDQKIQEMQLVVASKGWGYILDLWQQLIDRAEYAMKNPHLSDEETVIKKREWLSLQKAVISAVNAVETAAHMPLSNEIPR